MEIIKEKQINSVIQTALENIREMIDVNTVIGEAVVAGNGNTVIPVSKVSFGFVAGGGEYGESQLRQKHMDTTDADIPFAGGSGAGVTVQPLGFLVTGPDSVRLLPAQCYQPIDRLIELIPQAMAELRCKRKDAQPKPPERITVPITEE